jgi:type IV pilus assembly protein PilF
VRNFFILYAVIIFSGCVSSTKAGDRERAILHMQIGTGYLSKGQYPLAMSELLRAEELDPKNPLILNNLGLAYFVRGKTKIAEDKFRAAIQFAPKYTEAKNNLGRALIESNRPTEAIRVLREAEGDLTYEYPEKTFSNLGMAYFTSGQYKKAEEYLARSLEIRRQSCTTADYYGRTLLEMKQLEQSAKVLDQAIEYCRQDRFEEPIYFSAMSYFSLGQHEKARARLEELIKDYPKSKYVAKAKGMLELLQQ